MSEERFASPTRGAFERAREILAGDEPLTTSTVEELRELFHTVSATEFLALTGDPAHQRKLRAYDRICMLRMFVFLLPLCALFVLAVAAGFVLTSAH